ncbi:P-loop containing nucleoside triphosphate hydrolase protein [Xylaria arbuscula]|nr:P-loop containing nucleoside triphosphate hydrolase protein [Xylaria arbuscula]
MQDPTRASSQVAGQVHNDRLDSQADSQAPPWNDDGEPSPIRTSTVPQKRGASVDEEHPQEKAGHHNCNDDRLTCDATSFPRVSTTLAKEELQRVVMAGPRNISFNRPQLKDLNKVARSLGLPECEGPETRWSIEGLLQPLYPHQLLAVYFMLKRELSGEEPKGGIIADAMGLGKTVDALATVAINRPGEMDLSQVLIYNRAALTKVHGDGLCDFLQAQDLIIVSYQSLVQEWRMAVDLIMEDDLWPLIKMQFYRVILDEAHRIKNINSKKIYPHLEFLRMSGFSNGHYAFDDLYEVTEGKTQLGQILGRVMIRRNIDDTILGRQLIELPAAHREIVLVNQTRDERVIYKWFLKRTRDRFNRQLESTKSKLDSKKHLSSKKKRESSFSIVDILRLRQMACHLGLIEYMMAKYEINDVKRMLIDLAVEKGKNVFYDMISEWCREQELVRSKLAATGLSSQALPPTRSADASSSADKRPRYLRKPKRHLMDGPTDKILIFNEFIYCANIIGYILDDLQIKHLYYFGDKGPEVREEALKAFNYDPELKVMILSMKCGSEAIDLTCANRVISLEPWWNQGFEDQAFGRVYRYGQQKEVYHTRIIAARTIETAVIALQDGKEIAIANALEGRDTVRMSFTEQTAHLLGRVVYDAKGKVISVREEEDSDTDPEVDRDDIDTRPGNEL